MLKKIKEFFCDKAVKFLLTHVYSYQDPELEALYQKVIGRARSFGFSFEPPILRIMKDGALSQFCRIHDKNNEGDTVSKYVTVAMYIQAERPLIGRQTTVIVVAESSLQKYRDDEMTCAFLLAHELGHAIDAQYTDRTKHPFVERMISRPGKELFADAFVAYLYNPLMAVVVKRKLGDPRVREEQIAQIGAPLIPRRLK
ncbi:MAG: hypothetical protein Q8P69_02270 [bacterium]|nr:hypothetical protein [bacterium]